MFAIVKPEGFFGMRKIYLEETIHSEVLECADDKESKVVDDPIREKPLNDFNKSLC